MNFHGEILLIHGKIKSCAHHEHLVQHQCAQHDCRNLFRLLDEDVAQNFNDAFLCLVIDVLDLFDIKGKVFVLSITDKFHQMFDGYRGIFFSHLSTANKIILVYQI
jgi:hypothetical protein